MSTSFLASLGGILAEGDDHRPDLPVRYGLMLLNTTFSIGRVLYLSSAGFQDLEPLPQVLVTILTQHLVNLVLLGFLALARHHDGSLAIHPGGS